MTTIKDSLDKYGSCEISNGTLRTQDLIPAYLRALRELAPAAYQQIAVPGCGFSAFPSYAQEDSDSDWWHSDDAYSLLESLSDALSENAPEGFYFGAHEGDGACFGFWPMGDE
jgi:hypothetical protein